MEEEFWTTINGNNNYCISTFGNVENMITGRIMKAVINKEGYYIVNLYYNGKSKLCSIHRLVALAFLDNPENKNCVDHKNGNKLDNNINNLRFATHRK